MTLAEKLASVLQEAEKDPAYWSDIAITDFTRDLHTVMAREGISQGELARRMGHSRPYVTKLLGGSNFTLHTMVKLAMALDAVVRVRLEKLDERAREQRIAAAASESESVIVDFPKRRSEIKESGAAPRATTSRAASSGDAKFGWGLKWNTYGPSSAGAL